MVKKKCKNRKKNQEKKRYNANTSNDNSNVNNENTSNDYTSYNISDADLESLKLLNEQLVATKISFIVGILFYQASTDGIKLVLEKYTKEHTVDRSNIDVTVIKALYLALIQNLIITNVALTRYNIELEKLKEGKIDYSLQPNEDINVANALSLLSSYYGIKGAEGIYARNNNQPIFGL